MILRWSLLPLLATFSNVHAQAPGTISQVGDTIVSAMMLFLGNDKKVYIMDKVEGNPTKINNHPAWGAEWDIASNQATPMDMMTNVFCSSGMHLPNGSFATFGGNGIVGPEGAAPPQGALSDPTYGDFDGGTAIRILDPCTTTGGCKWFDDASKLFLQKRRWYSTAEPLADGTILLVGGFSFGGYINRNYPNTDPAYSGGASEPTFEYFPPRGTPAVMQFMITTSGLNSYAHLFLLPSGRVFAQANISTIVWDHAQNKETPLPDMPGGIARVYPASGAVAMLPLTPDNNYTPTILFCGGQNLPDAAWGNFAHPAVNTWEYPASNDCQRITPEPADGSAATYEQDDDMLEGRTMGQFIILPDGTYLVINGALNGTAGYADATGQTASLAQMPWGMSLASGPVYTPAIYDPSKPKGQRWSNAGLSASEIPRLYHSSALLLPDASVLVAGSNPNIDYNITRPFKTEYRAEKFYPPYWSAVRPDPQGIPTTLSYGGPSFDITIDSKSYSGDANDAAQNSKVVLIRPGFTTHAMNMGQRYVQLNNTFSVSNDGTITLHTSQAPPNANIITPGPVLLFVVVKGIPSIGKHIIVGTGQLGQQPTSAAAVLPVSVTATAAPKGNGPASKAASSGFHMSVAIYAAIGAGAVIAIIGGIVIWKLCTRKKDQVDEVVNMYSRGEKNRVSAGLGVPGIGGAQRGGFTQLHPSPSSMSVGGEPTTPMTAVPHRPESQGAGYGDYDLSYYDDPNAQAQAQQHQQPMAYQGGGPGGQYMQQHGQYRGA